MFMLLKRCLRTRLLREKTWSIKNIPLAKVSFHAIKKARHYKTKQLLYPTSILFAFCISIDDTWNFYTDSISILASSHLSSVDHQSADRCTVVQKCKNYICVSVCILQSPKTFRSLLATLFQLAQAICLVFLLHLVSLVMFTCTSGCLISLCKVLCTVHPISERSSFCSLRDL